MSNLKKVIVSFLLSFLLILFLPIQTVSAYVSNTIPFIILSQYDATLDIGDEFHIIAFTSTGKKATWKSSDSKIASVNTYGKVIAKKEGTVIITSKIKNAEAYCQITVNKTRISISQTDEHIERGESIKLTGSTSNGSNITWKSSKKSVATVDEYGTVTGKKPGETIITCAADGTKATCKVTVDFPTIKLSQSTIKLFRGQTAKLSANVSSKVNPTWKTNKKSVAIVDQNGNITAVKNGSATITATIDGVLSNCEVIVEKPVITLSSTDLSLKVGMSVTVTASVSSGNIPIWSTSNSKIVSINSKGQITALKKGKTYIYAKEDGTKVRCTIHVTE